MFVQKVVENTSETVFWSLLTLTLTLCVIYAFRGYLKAVFLSLKLSGPAAVPIFGNCLLLKEKDLPKLFANAFTLYGPLVRVWVLLFPFFAVLQPDDLQLILSSNKNTSKVFFYRLMLTFLGDGLITSSGNQWHNHRRLIQPTFHLNTLESYIGTFANASQDLCDTLNEVSDQEINVGKYINSCVVNILNEIVLGVAVKKKDTMDTVQSPFRQGKLILPERFLKPWLLWDSLYQLSRLASDELVQQKRLSEFTRQMLAKRRVLKSNNNAVEKKCLLDYMIDISDNNPEFTEEDIVNEACTFMLAGQDSAATAIATTIFLLAQNYDCQQKCSKEIERIFGNDNRAPNMQDLRDMRYLEMCIKESLRLYPSIPLIARKLDEDVRLAKYTLPAGSNVFICPYATHRLEEIYPEPEKFDPERFTPENSKNRHPYAYLPFSAGPRYCIGNRFAILEMKTIISRLLRSYYILPVPGKTVFEATFRITLRASGGLWVRLKPKQHKITNFSCYN